MPRRGHESGGGRADDPARGHAGLSQRARRLLCDPIAWSAKVATWTLMLAIVFVMTAKPSSVICAIALAVALVCECWGPYRSGPSGVALQRRQSDDSTTSSGMPAWAGGQDIASRAPSARIFVTYGAKERAVSTRNLSSSVRHSTI